MKGVLYTIMAFTFLCIVSSCKENVKTGLTSTKTFEEDSLMWIIWGNRKANTAKSLFYFMSFETHNP